MDYDQLRETLVRRHIEPAGVRDRRVLEAVRKVPRHEFVPEMYLHAAYEDQALPIGEGQTISQPSLVALMTEMLDVQPEHRVLEIGTGSGYQAAILAELGREVYTVERRETLSSNARSVLRRLGYANVIPIVGDGSQGHKEAAPYDRIIVTASCPEIPGPLVEQLAIGGRMVLPIGDYSYQVLTVVDKEEKGLRKRDSVACVFVPLVGRFAWGEDAWGRPPEW